MTRRPPSHFRTTSHPRALTTLDAWVARGLVIVDEDEDGGGLGEAIEVASIGKVWTALRPREVEAEGARRVAVFTEARKHGDKRKAIMEWLEANGPAKTRAVAAAFPAFTRVDCELANMATQGRIERVGWGRYGPKRA